jgi:hypothetical protein
MVDEQKQPDAQPSSNGSNGRQSGGRFGVGNGFARGRGNPHAGRVYAVQSLLREETTDDDLLAIWRKLIEMAKAGDKDAAKTVLDRMLGKVRDAEPTPRPDSDEPRRVVLLDWRARPHDGES